MSDQPKDQQSERAKVINELVRMMREEGFTSIEMGRDSPTGNMIMIVNRGNMVIGEMFPKTMDAACDLIRLIFTGISFREGD